MKQSTSSGAFRRAVFSLGVVSVLAACAATDAAPLRATVEVEEPVYDFEPANNGAGPMWCHGSTCLARMGETVFASGLETMPARKPLNNCRWMFFQRDSKGWRKLAVDQTGRTREPCPLALFEDGRIFLSVNPTLVSNPNAYAGPAKPEILQFSAAQPEQPFTTTLPGWKGSPVFTEHSYRSLAADGRGHELILFQNIGYTHAEWAFRDREGKWAASGQLAWPWGAEYEKPQPIRVCYPNVALRNGAVHFCGVSDIVEPKSAWRKFKKELTGREWDYDFRRLYYTWSPDIRSGRFEPWLELASREATAGWITPGDLWLGPDGRVHILWTERAIDERLREKFFPNARQCYALNYAQIRDGKVLARRTLVEALEKEHEIPGRGRFHETPDGRLLVIFYVHGNDRSGRRISENRFLELRDGVPAGPAAVLPLKRPFDEFFTATPRAGTAPSWILDILGQQAGVKNRISYARLRFF